MKRCLSCMTEYADNLTTCPQCGYAEGTVAENALHMSPGSILADRYIVGKVIGFGGFGVTYIGWDALLETKIAIKEYLPSEFSTRVVGQTQVTVFSGDKQEQFTDGMKKFIDEAKKLAKFHSTPGIVKIFDSFEANNTAYIIMELLEGETLAEKLKREKKISEDRAIEMMKPIIESLKVVHADGIIHRDIAPDNIFVTKDGEVKLIDFGAARYATTTHSRSLTVIIKPGYSPEEQYRSRGDQGPHTDVYAVAATLYKMITGVTPPDALERRAFFENKQKDILEPMGKYEKSITDNHETAILNALNVRIEDRTADMQTFLDELTSSESVKRRVGKIKKIDVLKWPLWAKIGAPTFAAALITFTVLFVTGVIGFNADLMKDIIIPEGQTRVPSVVSDEYEKGEQRLTEARLLVRFGESVESEEIPENLILTQSVTAGTLVEVNTPVELVMSAGVIKIPVPNVVGLEKEKAVEQIEAIGLSVSIEEVYDAVIAENCVISQSIAPDTKVRQDSEITLTISKGRDPSVAIEEKDVKVPEFIGMKFDEAAAKARDMELTIKVTEYKYSKTYEKDIIMDQNPEANKTIKNTQIVELTVSLGYSKVEVPNVIHMSEEQAIKLIKAQGLVAKVTYENSESVEAGLVLSQDPKAKTKVDPETTVNVVVSKGAAAFDMPDVVGMQEAEAVKLLQGKYLVVTVSYEKNSSKPKGEVLSQDPKANTKVRGGDSVTIVVCTHEDVVEVPDVVGKSRSDAEKTIKGKGLVPNVVEINSDSVPKGIVISQAPTGGTGAKRGGTVTINVSLGKKNEPSSDSRSDNSSSKPSETKPSSEPSTSKPDDTVPDDPSLSLSDSFKNVNIGESFELQVNGKNISSTLVSWSVMDTSLLSMEVGYSSLNSDHTYVGVCSFTALRPGSTFVIVKYGTVSVRCSVTVTVNNSTIKITKVEYPSEDEILFVGDTVKIYGTATNTDSVWIGSSNDDIIDGGYGCGIASGYSGKPGDFCFSCECRSAGTVTLDISTDSGVSTTVTFTVNDAGEHGRVLRDYSSIQWKWKYYEDGTLEYIWSADGSVPYYGSVPKSYSGVEPVTYDMIKNVIIDDGFTRIVPYAFIDCQNLESCIIPDTVREISDYAFSGCWNLSYINFPDALETIGYAAFRACRKLETIDLPVGVTYINDEAFRACWSLKTVYSLGSIDRLNLHVFMDCTDLETIQLPDTLTSFSFDSVSGCTALTELYFPSVLSSINVPYSYEIPNKSNLTLYCHSDNTQIPEFARKWGVKYGLY